MTARLPGTPSMLLSHWMKTGLVLLYAILLAFVLSQCGRLGEPAPQAPKEAVLAPDTDTRKGKGPALRLGARRGARPGQQGLRTEQGEAARRPRQARGASRRHGENAHPRRAR